MFWTYSVTPLITKDFQALDSLVRFPLEGEWGFLMGLKKEEKDWTKSDFFENYDKLFTSDLIEQLTKYPIENLEIMSSKNGDVEILIFLDIGTLSNEMGLILRYKLEEKHWKLCTIQAIG